ncbi:MAG: hypothetical protein Q9195_006987 [Heterodermia aff. obscurata]
MAQILSSMFSENCGYAHFLPHVHLQLPQHRKRQKEKSKVRDNVAEAMNVDNIVGSWIAVCRWAQIKLDVPIGFNRMTRKNHEKKCNSGPDHKKKANNPGRNSKFEVDIKDTIQEQEKRDLGEHNTQNVEVAGYGAPL